MLRCHCSGAQHGRRDRRGPVCPDDGAIEKPAATMELITSMVLSVDGVVQGSARRRRTAAADERGGWTNPYFDHETPVRPPDQRGRPESRRSLMAIRTARTAWNGTLQEGSG